MATTQIISAGKKLATSTGRTVGSRNAGSDLVGQLSGGQHLNTMNYNTSALGGNNLVKGFG
jgi:hypothetical protein